ncbi:C2 calcium-dependent domain-containing protein 4C [Salmo salar]|uniref:C2 calcium-dependent domain-containing protein 4C n=1 Tax=Salmo salar TaxID=8030 RepID=A0A1S3PIV6_SALSA|nr:C2 calcium-dependent domain-containing protein 4C [Salmo salar]|eukprot:XP_014027531.1 PREDICTED: C2 calcium-dependent domain-containing protein 4C-like [Salmo salar]
MWFLGKIRESMENIPLELGRYVGKSEEEDLSAKASLSNKLHSNILTPDKIPEFCLPPRLCRSLVAAEPHTVSQRLTSRDCGAVDFSVTPQVKQVEEMKLTKVSCVAWRGKKPLPFSAEGYGLAGMYESPNTRRKESLFHSKSTGYTLDRTLPRPTTRVAIERNQCKAPPIQLGLELGLSCKSLSESGSTESDTPSSNDSSPLGSPLLSRSCSGLSLSIIAAWAEGPPGLQSASAFSGTLGLEGASPCSAVNPRGRRGAISPIPSTSLIEPCSSPPFVVNSLAPPVLFPLDVLHCQERMQREHVLPLPEGRGRVRLSAEHTLSPSLLSMVVRVRVVSVEGLRDEGDPRALHCCLSLSLSPGKLQRQDSATIRNCRSPVFNEDFFFTELSLDSLGGLRLQLKVLDKASGLRRGTVLGIIITEPLAQLLPL